MSRSTKKPYISWACHARGSMSKWKSQCNRSIRRIPVDKEIDDMSYVRKLNERYTAPDDGHQYWDDPRARRK